MNQTANQYAKDLRGHDTRFRIVATWGNIAILEDGNSRQEYTINNKPQVDSLIIDGRYYQPLDNPTIANKN